MAHKQISVGNYTLLRRMIAGECITHLPGVPSQLVTMGLATLEGEIPDVPFSAAVQTLVITDAGRTYVRKRLAAEAEAKRLAAAAAREAEKAQ